MDRVRVATCCGVSWVQPHDAGSFPSYWGSNFDSHIGVTVVEDLIAQLGTVCAGLPDQRKGPRRDGDYTMADIGLSAFSVFFMGSPSFLAHQRALARDTAGRTARPCSA